MTHPTPDHPDLMPLHTDVVAALEDLAALDGELADDIDLMAVMRPEWPDELALVYATEGQAAGDEMAREGLDEAGDYLDNVETWPTQLQEARAASLVSRITAYLEGLSTQGAP